MGCGASAPVAPSIATPTANQRPQQVPAREPNANAPGNNEQLEATKAAAQEPSAPPSSREGGADEAERSEAPPAARRHVSQCAVTLAFLKQFFREHVAARPDADTVTTEAIKNDVILKLTEQHQCRYLDVPGLVSDPYVVGPPDYFISHAWRNPFKLLVDCVAEHLKFAVDTDVRVWVDVFAVDQHTSMDQDLQGLHQAINACTSGTLVVLDEGAEPIRRSWCLYEFINTVKYKSIDKLGFLGSSATSKDKMAQVFLAIDVEKAGCFDEAKRVEILNDIISEFKTAEAFNNQLKLMLLLNPLDYSMDIHAFLQRLGDDPASQYQMDPVWDALQQQHESSEREAPTLTCVVGSSGSGKSAMSAVLCSGACQRNEHQVIHAHHFFKHNDRRREEPSRVIMSLAYQLALAFPELQRHYCSLSVEQLRQADSDLDAAFELLLKVPMPTDRPVTILLDALDEGEMRPEAPSVATNLGFQLLKRFTQLPSNVNIVVTTRPGEPARLLEVLHRKYPAMVELDADRLRNITTLQRRLSQQLASLAVGGVDAATTPLLLDAAVAGDNAMVYLTVVLQLLGECGQGPSELPRNLDQAYGAVFSACSQRLSTDSALAERAKRLLAVLMAAREPLPLSMLAAMGLLTALDHLPAGLFFPRNYTVHTLHKSVHDWLVDPGRSGQHHADVQAGHYAIASRLTQQINGGAADGYTLKYVMAHMAAASQQCAAMMVQVLQDYAFIERVFKQGHGLRFVHDLGRVPSPSKEVADSLRWLQYFSHDLQQHPEQALATALRAPINTSVFKHAERISSQWRTAAAMYWQDWPSITATLVHDGEVSNVALSPDGSRVATVVSNDNGKAAVWLWDTTTHECTATLQGHTRTISDVVFRPDGSCLATASWDTTVRLWDTATQECLVTLQGHTLKVNGVAFRPNASCLASASDDKTVRMWDVTTHECTATLHGHTHGVTCVAFSPDGSRLAAGGYDGTVWIWDATTHQCIATLQGHEGGVENLAFSPDGSRLVALSQYNVLYLWDTATNQRTATLRGLSSGEALLSVAFSPDGTRLATGTWGKTVCIWDATTLECLAILRGHNAGVTSLAFSPDGSRLLTGSHDKNVCIWDTTTRDFTAPSQGHTDGVTAVAFSPDGSRLATGSVDNTLRIWDPTTHECVAKLQLHSDGIDGLSAAPDVDVTSLAFSPDGSRIATGCTDRAVRIWDATTHECITTLTWETTKAVRSVAFSPDGSRLAIGSWDKDVRIWDTTTHECIAMLQGHTNSVPCLAFSPDGSRLATGGWDFIVCLWDVATYARVATLEGHGLGVSCVAFSPNGSRVVSGSWDESVRVWDTATLQCIAILHGHTDIFWCVAFSPDGSRFATASSDKTVRVWDAAAHVCIATLYGHTGGVQSVAFNADGSRLATCSWDKTVRIWDATRI